VHSAGKILRGIDFHPIDAVQLRFAHGGPREPRAVDVLVFDETFLEPARADVRIIIGRARIQRFAHHLHARALDAAGRNLVADVDGVVAAARIHIQNRGETGGQVDLGVGECD